MQKDTLVLIDGHALAYRMFYALPVNAFSTNAGEITNATFGFTRQLLDILLDNPPDYLAVAFDAGMSQRDAIYPDYKATREKAPDELGPQIERIQEILAAFGVPVLIQEGWEADDVIGTAAAQAEAKGLHVHIVTGDKDLLQLVTDATHVQLPGRRAGEVKLYDVARFREEYGGLSPEQLPDLKGLMGDSSDNIPGVHRIGEKTGTRLLQEYGTLEGTYAHLEEIKGAKKKYLAKDRENAFLSKRLATIHRDMPITLDLEQCRLGDHDYTTVSALFRELQFRQFSSRLNDAKRNPPATGQQLSLFGEDTLPAQNASPTEATIINDAHALTALAARLAEAEAITVDVETTGTDQMAVDLVGIAVTDTTGKGFYIPVGHLTGEPQLSLEAVIKALRPALTDPNIPKYGHNIKYDYVVLHRHGLDVAPLGYDTMLAAWLLNPDDSVGLKAQAYTRLGVSMQPIEDLIGKGRSQITMAQVRVEAAAPYAAADADMTHRLAESLTPELKDPERYPEESAWRLFTEMEMPLVPVLADMEMHGVLLDASHLAQMSRELDEKLQAVEGQIHGMAGHAFNLNSPQQLAEALFDKMSLPREGLRKTASGYISTAASVLESILVDGERPPVIDLILTYRELAKLKGTYVDALPQLINPQTGRVHTSFNQTGTNTGRLSSSDPNLQNIPIRTETGARVRHAFVAPEGKVLLACDYSQVELRVLAHICQDPGLLRAFREGEDIHAATAAVVFDIPIDEVTKNHRSFAKRVNFGLIYGMTAHRLMRETDLTFAEAERFVESYFDGFPNVQAYLEDTKAKAARLGYVETLFGRRRYFPHLREMDPKDRRRQRAEREAINMPIQGTAADILKVAMIRLHAALRAQSLGGRMNLQVHDELVLEVPTDELAETAALVREVMEGAYALDAPLVVDANAGPNWGEMEPL